MAKMDTRLGILNSRDVQPGTLGSEVRDVLLKASADVAILSGSNPDASRNADIRAEVAASVLWNASNMNCLDTPLQGAARDAFIKSLHAGVGELDTRPSEVSADEDWDHFVSELRGVSTRLVRMATASVEQGQAEAASGDQDLDGTE